MNSLLLQSNFNSVILETITFANQYLYKSENIKAEKDSNIAVNKNKIVYDVATQ